MKYSRFPLYITLMTLLAVSVYFEWLRHSTSSFAGQPLFLVPSALMSLVGLFWPKPMRPTQKGKYVGFFRRLFALGIDAGFLFSMIMITTMPIAYVSEWLATGQWQWVWDRESKLRDTIPLIAYYGCFAWAFFHYTRRVRAGEPTIGQFAMEFRIVAAPDGPPDYARRFRYGAFGLCIYPLTALLALRKSERRDGIFDWDAVSNTRAVSTRAL